MAERLTVLVFGVAAALVFAGAAAQPLADPTRPPLEPSAGPRQGEAAPDGARLQSVLISPTRSIAIIDGRPVGLGGRVGEATVTAIEPFEVTLSRGAGRETLKLLPPAVDKKRIKP